MKGEQGFTLVELLVALVAGGLLLALLGAMTGALGAEVRRAARDDRFSEIAAAGPLLDHLLAGAMPAPGSRQAIEADAGHLSTYVDPPLSRRGAGLMRLDLAVVHEADGEALQLTLSPADPSDGAPPGSVHLLVHGMKAIEISTDDAVKPDAGNAVRLPRLVTIAFTTPAGETWEAAVEPRLSGSGGCRFDPISLTCRA